MIHFHIPALLEDFILPFFHPKAARNCLVSKNNEVKVSDFGMTRYVHEDQFFKLLYNINVTVSHSLWSVSTLRTLDLFLMISTRAHSAPSSLSSGQPQRSSDTANSAPSLTSGRSVSLGARLPFSCLVCISDSLVRALTEHLRCLAGFAGWVRAD